MGACRRVGVSVLMSWRCLGGSCRWDAAERPVPELGLWGQVQRQGWGAGRGGPVRAGGGKQPSTCQQRQASREVTECLWVWHPGGCW